MRSLHVVDPIGGVVAAAVTAVGGGTIRDLLLDRHLRDWLTDTRHLLVILGSALATMASVRRARAPGATLDVADALGLALCSVTRATLDLLLVRVGIARPAATVAGTGCLAAVRIASLRWRLELPAFEVRTDEHVVPPGARRPEGGGDGGAADGAAVP